MLGSPAAKGHGLVHKTQVKWRQYSAKIDARIVVNKCGCHIWHGAKKKGYVCYEGIQANFPDTGWHTLHAHKLRYLVHNRVLSVDGALEVSYLCHEPLCINAEHLSLKSHSCNTDRLRYVNRSTNAQLASCKVAQRPFTWLMVRVWVREHKRSHT